MTEKRVHILAISRRGEENLGISRPTKSLVPLGAIRRKGKEIGTLAPRDVLVKLGDERILRMKFARFFQRGRNGNLLHRKKGGIPLNFNFGVAETMEGEAGQECLLPFSPENEIIFRLSLSEILGVEFPVVFQPFAVPSPQNGASRTFGDNVQHRGAILPEIETHARAGRKDRLSFGPTDFFDRRQIRRGHLNRNVIGRYLLERRRVKVRIGEIDNV